MNSSLLALLGIAAGVVNVLSLVPYVRDIFKHKTKPERASWWIWSIIFTSVFFAQLDMKAGWSVGLTVGQVIGTTFVAILSIKYGYGRFERKDIISLVLACIGIILWRLTSQPLVALAILICIDMVAVALTIKKAWKAPETETLISWILILVSSILALLSVGTLWTINMIYPVYTLLTVLAILGTILAGRKVRLTSDTMHA